MGGLIVYVSLHTQVNFGHAHACLYNTAFPLFPLSRSNLYFRYSNLFAPTVLYLTLIFP